MKKNKLKNKFKKENGTIIFENDDYDSSSMANIIVEDFCK